MLQKHARYKDAYIPDDMYWGLGVENETYIELEGGARTQAAFIAKHQARERYSVDYWKLYKSGCVDAALAAWMARLPQGAATPVNLPVLINGHTFTKTDRYGEPVTLYTTGTPPNPRFCGRTLLEDLARLRPDVFVDGRDVWWTFDGDTVEFMTQGFYCAKLEDVVAELLGHKARWMEALRSALATLDREAALKKQPVYPPKNYGLAVFLTNRENVAIFNNGTLHINLTLPTRLDKNGHIVDMTQFRAAHQALARMFQWITPFLVARFGSGDVFANLGDGDPAHTFPAGSQRICASRYVSAGTYDTDTMPPGKILTRPRESIGAQWYTDVYDRPGCAYMPLAEIGLDINYQKHWNHGLEFRIFDWFPETELDGVLRLLVWMCDAAAAAPVPNPRLCPIWNACMSRAVWDGTSALLTDADAHRFQAVFGDCCALRMGMTYDAVYDAVWNGMRRCWNAGKAGSVTAHMIRTPLPVRPEDLEPCSVSAAVSMFEEESAAAVQRTSGNQRVPTVLSSILLLRTPPAPAPTLAPSATVETVAPPPKSQWWCCRIPK